MKVKNENQITIFDPFFRTHNYNIYVEQFNFLRVFCFAVYVSIFAVYKIHITSFYYFTVLFRIDILIVDQN